MRTLSNSIQDKMSHVFVIRDSSVTRSDNAICFSLLTGGYVKILTTDDDNDLWYSAIYCHYRILQLRSTTIHKSPDFDTATKTVFVVFKCLVDVYEKRKASILPWRSRV